MKYKRFSGSLMGKTTTIIPKEDCIDIYTTGTWFILISLWVFAMGLFGISLFFNNLVVSVIMTLLGAFIGVFLAMKLYIGKLHTSFSYDKISCMLYNRPNFSIIDEKEKILNIHMLPQKFESIMTEVGEQVKENPNMDFEKRNNRYYLKKVKTAE